MSSQAREKIRVFARIRPSTEEKLHKVVNFTKNNVTINLNDEPKSFEFDGVFGEDSRQEDVFDGAASQIVHGTLQGYNGTIFAYGQTGSGKTYTMVGNSDNNGEGIIPRGLRLLFDLLEKKKQEMPGQFTSKITISFVEIYNENIYDLFLMNEEKLKIGQDKRGNAMVKGATEIFVKDLSDAMEEVSRGWNNRKVAETAMNRMSSRSHALVLIKIHTEEVHGNGNEHGPISTARSAFLNLVDLAGSERVSQTKVEGERLRETNNINKSLFTLKHVIRELSDPTTTNGFIAFRSSILTHLLKDSLGGNARTAVMITLHSEEKYHSETLSTLQFSAEVRTIENKVVVNEDLKGESVEAFKLEIKRLKEEKEMIQNQSAEELATMNRTIKAIRSAQLRDLEEFNLVTFERDELQSQLTEEKKEKAELQEKLNRLMEGRISPVREKEAREGDDTYFVHESTTSMLGNSLDNTGFASPAMKRRRMAARFIPARDCSTLEVMDNDETINCTENNDVMELEKRINLQQQSIAEKEKECKTLNGLLANAEKKIVEVEGELTRALKRCMEKEEEVKELSVDQAKTKEALVEETRKVVDLAKSKSLMKDLVIETRVQVHRLQSDIDHLKLTHADELKELEENRKRNLSDVENKEAGLNAEINRLKRVVKEKDFELGDKKTEKKETESVLFDLRDRLDIAKRDENEQKIELDNVTAQLQKLRGIMENQKKEMNVEKMKREDIHRERLAALEGEMEKRMKELTNERRNVQQMREISSTEVERLRKEMIVLRSAKENTRCYCDDPEVEKAIEEKRKAIVKVKEDARRKRKRVM